MQLVVCRQLLFEKVVQLVFCRKLLGEKPMQLVVRRQLLFGKLVQLVVYRHLLGEGEGEPMHLASCLGTPTEMLPPRTISCLISCLRTT